MTKRELKSLLRIRLIYFDKVMVVLGRGAEIGRASCERV